MSLFLGALSLVGVIALFSAAAGSAARPLLVGLSRAERAGWSVWMGLALAALVWLGAAGLGMRPGPVAMLGAAVAVGAATWRRRGHPSAPEERPGRFAWALVAATAAAVAVFAIVALSEPMWSNDFLAIWGFKGKTMYFAGSIPARLFRDPASAWSHPEYPLWLPAVFAALSASIGQWDGHALAVLFPVLQAATAAAIYGWGKRRFAATAGAATALLACAFFPLYQAFEVGMAEVPLTLGLVLFAAAALDFRERPDRAAAARLALSAFLAASVKQEGSLFVVLVGVALAAESLRGRRSVVAPVSLTVVPAVFHQMLLTAWRGRIADRDFDWAFARPDHWAMLARRIGEAAGHLVRPGYAAAWIAILALVGFALLARPAAGPPALAILGSALAVQGAIYLAVCGISVYGPRWQVEFVPRLLGALFPVAVFALLPRLAWVLGGRASGPCPSDRVAAE